MHNTLIVDSPIVAMVTFHSGQPHTSDRSMASSETGTLVGEREGEWEERKEEGGEEREEGRRHGITLN